MTTTSSALPLSLQPALRNLRMPRVPTLPPLARSTWLVLAFLGLTVLTFGAIAAGTGGTALQGAYTTFNDMVNGYGKQLLTSIAFALALIGWLASNSTAVILKFVGFAIFGGVGLAAAVGLVGAVI